MNKPREFWIEIGRIYDGTTGAEGTVEKIAVIEYSAYADALKMLEEMAVTLETVMCDTQEQYMIRLADDALENYRKWKEGMK